MDLHQLQLTYQADQDRLLLRVSFKAGDGSLQEIRAWLTRRLVRNFWPGTIKAMETQVRLSQPHAAHASAEIVGMGYQASVSQLKENGGFAAPFEASAQEYPLGEAPILVTAAHFHIDADQPLRIDFAQSESQGFEVAFTPAILHGFCTLLQDAVKQAEWDIELRLPGTADIASVPRVLN